jgi:hypothetical protein
MIASEAVAVLANLSDAEEFFEALEQRYDPRVLDAHRLQIMRVFALALGSWLRSNPSANARERRDAAARALREAHDVFAEEDERGGETPLSPGSLRPRGPR